MELGTYFFNNMGNIKLEEECNKSKYAKKYRIVEGAYEQFN